VRSNRLSYAPEALAILACALEAHKQSSPALASARLQSMIDLSAPVLVLTGSSLRPGHNLAR